MSWVKTVPANNGKLIDAPAQIRANWDAIELGTDSALQITNAKVAVGAGIVEAKCAFDGSSGHDHSGSTAGKKIILTSATSVTGVLPIANGGTGSSSTTYCSLTANVSGVLPIANGGTGQITAQLALNALAGAVTNNRVLRGNGTNIVLAQVDLTTDVTGALPIANGGTGQTSANNALNALLPSQGGNAGKFLKTDASNTSWDTPAGILKGWELLYEGAMSASDVTISGLDGNTSKVFKLVLVGGYNNGHVYCQPNADTTAGNYYHGSYIRDGAVGSGYPNASPTGLGLYMNHEQYANGYCVLEAIMSAVSGQYRIMHGHGVGENTSDRHGGVQDILTVWENSADNITSIVIKGTFTGRVLLFGAKI